MEIPFDFEINVAKKDKYECKTASEIDEPLQLLIRILLKDITYRIMDLI